MTCAVRRNPLPVAPLTWGNALVAGVSGLLGPGGVLDDPDEVRAGVALFEAVQDVGLHIAERDPGRAAKPAWTAWRIRRLKSGRGWVATMASRVSVGRVSQSISRTPSSRATVRRATSVGLWWETSGVCAGRCPPDEAGMALGASRPVGARSGPSPPAGGRRRSGGRQACVPPDVAGGGAGGVTGVIRGGAGWVAGPGGTGWGRRGSGQHRHRGLGRTPGLAPATGSPGPRPAAKSPGLGQATGSPGSSASRPRHRMPTPPSRRRASAPPPSRHRAPTPPGRHPAARPLPRPQQATRWRTPAETRKSVQAPVW